MVYPSDTVRTFIKHMLIFSVRQIPHCYKRYKNNKLTLTNNLASLNCNNTLTISYLTIIIAAFKLLYRMISFLITYKSLISPYKFFIFVNIFINMMNLAVLEWSILNKYIGLWRLSYPILDIVLSIIFRTKINLENPYFHVSNIISVKKGLREMSNL